MPAEVKILIEGTTNADSVAEIGEEKTRPTITLVRDGDIVMVIDPGVLESQQDLCDALEKENLAVDDVNIVCITHSHIDHFRNVGMFPKAKVLEYYGLWDKLTVLTWSEKFTENIRIMHTPGHDYSSITLFVATKEGITAVCGDVFWKENYPERPEDDVFASNPAKLKESRETVLKMADWIIPGHGPVFRSNKGVEDKKTEGDAAKAKITVTCKRCGRQMKQQDKCQCRPYLCYRCCMCGLDCDACNCSHKNSRI